MLIAADVCCLVLIVVDWCWLGLLAVVCCGCCSFLVSVGCSRLFLVGGDRCYVLWIVVGCCCVLLVVCGSIIVDVLVWTVRCTGGVVATCG